MTGVLHLIPSRHLAQTADSFDLKPALNQYIFSTKLKCQSGYNSRHKFTSHALLTVCLAWLPGQERSNCPARTSTCSMLTA